MGERRCLIIVDVQNDFCPGGSLPVLTGDMVIEPINDMIAHALAHDWLVVASQDWHPKHTVHFAQDRTDGKGWPVHCVQNTRGAEFHPGLKTNDQVVVVRKGLDPQNDGGYSAFEGEDSYGRSLEEVLREENVGKIFVVGLATDYCVKATVLGARECGFWVCLVLDAIRAVKVGPVDEVKAIAAMISAGAHFTTTEEIIGVEK